METKKRKEELIVFNTLRKMNPDDQKILSKIMQNKYKDKKKYLNRDANRS